MNARSTKNNSASPQRAGRPAAAALHYDPAGTEAPGMIAIGRGLVAEEIVRAAREADVPLHQDAGLVEALSSSTSAR